MLKKLPFVIPLLALIALLVWWFTPRYSEEEIAWYRSVFCVIDHRDSQAFLRDMENIVEGGNADYALHKNHYIPALGERMRQTWLQLSQQEQESIAQDQQRCRERKTALTLLLNSPAARQWRGPVPQWYSARAFPF